MDDALAAQSKWLGRVRADSDGAVRGGGMLVRGVVKVVGKG